MAVTNLCRRPKQNLLHVDFGQLVVNVHLSARHNQTGTQFLGSAGGHSYGLLGSEPEELRAAGDVLNAFPDALTLDECIRVAGGAERPPSGHTGRGDPTGVTEFVDELPFRLNQMVAYSGHLFHSSQVGADHALHEDPRHGRIALRYIVPSPALVRLSERNMAFMNSPGEMRRFVRRLEERHRDGLDRIGYDWRALLQEMGIGEGEEEHEAAEEQRGGDDDDDD
eukprot:g857.t1